MYIYIYITVDSYEPRQANKDYIYGRFLQKIENLKSNGATKATKQQYNH